MIKLQIQIRYYEKLDEVKREIFRIFALKASFNHASEIVDLFVNNNTKPTQKFVKACMDNAVLVGILLISENQYQWNGKRYRLSLPFMTYIYRELKDYKAQWSFITKNYHPSVYSYERSDELTIAKKFLYELLFQKEIATDTQNKVSGNWDLIENLEILDYPEYLENINKMDMGLLNKFFGQKTNIGVRALVPMSELRAMQQKIIGYLDMPNFTKFETVDNNLDFYSGNFTAIIKRNTSPNLAIVTAIHLLVTGNVDNAMKLFSNELKEMRYEFKGLQTFPVYEHNYFYFVGLLCMPPDKTAVLAQKILNTFVKGYYSAVDANFQAVLHNILNDKFKRDTFKTSLFNPIITNSDGVALLNISLAYLAEMQPPLNAKAEILKVIEKGCAAENYVLTYEAAFVANKWFDTPKTAELYERIAAHMTYKPACSLVTRQEEWEKSLNLLMGAVGGTRAVKSTAKADENANRIVYMFEPNRGDVQPVLQTRSAKGEWSKGRNIAMKTFYEGKTKGMTEQDFKIAKSIKHYKGGYYQGDSYDFTDKTKVELIGHPYIYLANANEVPMELVAAEPIISVSKKSNGYSLKSDISDLTSGIIVEKETNTRYKVYNLSNSQMALLKVITEQKLVVPEQGKAKLIQLLGDISKYATVHSDLLSTDGQLNVKVKTVTPDNRIRVQLLPFGDGLKAELFAKPFGNIPPYCKPGVGGKVLIANEKGAQLQVKRNFAAEQKLANLLLNDIQQLESVNMSDDLIAFDDPLDSLHLLDVLTQHKEECVVEWPEGERFKIRATASFGNLKMQIKSKNNWFELDGELKVDEDTVISLQQLMNMVATSHDRFIELKNGEFLALSAELKKRLNELYTFSTKGKGNLQINKFASVALGDMFDEVENLKADNAWKTFRKQLENQATTEANIPTSLQAELRPYQEEGFRWMARIAEWEGGACLADDMGLGKTIQTLAVLLHRTSKGPALVICPVSVVGNWIAEAARFAPTLNVKLLGNNNRQQTLDELTDGDVLITSYGLLQSEEKIFVEKEFATVVLDEAHIIKNYATKTSKATMQLKAGFRLALTGTPLQNHQGEIWNLFNFINPGLLGNLTHFTDTFIKPDNDFSRKLLKKLIKPFILRRTKSAVLDELPPKTEIIKKIQLSEAEMAFYEALRRQAVLNLELGEGNKQFQVLAEITKLRQASCNPQLVDKNIGIESSKLATFLEIVDELIENKHRALVFSQFVTHLSIVRAALDKKGIKYQYLDGSSPMPERERSVKNFQNGEGELFLISLKAGGLGLNLTAADYVIHLDPWWNPAVEDQASDRAHRIGQKRPVTIYRLVAENTIEEKIIQLHNTKRDLADSLLEGSDQSAKMSFGELVSLIQETSGL